MVEKRIGDYEILRELGRGGMGVVYKAHDISLKRTVALKVLLEGISDESNYLERFTREARAAARVTHPNIVTVYAAGEKDGVPYIAMEYVEGRTLDAYVRDAGRLAVPEALALTLQIADALEVAHESEIIHRDIKPQNIMIDRSGRVRVMDFGLAKVLLPNITNVTMEGAIIGTPMYMSPEQCKGLELDQRTDIYSLGIVLFEMLAGKPPFQAQSALDLMRKIVDEPSPDISLLNPDVPGEVCSIVSKMIAKRPGHRYSKASDLKADIRAFIRLEDDQSREMALSASAERAAAAETVLEAQPFAPSGKRIVKWMAGAAVAILLAAGGFIASQALNRGAGDSATPPPEEQKAETVAEQIEVPRSSAPAQTETLPLPAEAEILAVVRGVERRAVEARRRNLAAAPVAQAFSPPYSPPEIPESAPEPEIEDGVSPMEDPPFEASFYLGQPDKHLYHFGDAISFEVMVSRDSDVLLFVTDSEGETTLLFPNKYEPEGFVPARETLLIPDPGRVPEGGSGYALRAAAPVGPAVFELYALDGALDVEQALDFTSRDFIVLEEGQDAAAFLEGRGLSFLERRTLDVEVSE